MLFFFPSAGQHSLVDQYLIGKHQSTLMYACIFLKSKQDFFEQSSIIIISHDVNELECIHAAQSVACYDNVGSFAEEDVGRHGVTPAVGSANASRGLEVAVANLQEYCNGQFASFLLSIKVLFSM